MIGLTLLAIMSLPALAQGQGTIGGTYVCIDEFGGGVRYAAGRWQGTVFTTERKFIIQLSLRDTRPFKGGVYEDYSMTTTESGTNYHSACTYSGEFADASVVTIDTAIPVIGCWSSFENYRVNFKTLRFLRAYIVGYIDGQDDNSNTPAIMGGTCTKLQ